jgi:hypothetical protein
MTSIRDIALITVWFQPLFAWLGLLTIISLLITATLGYSMVKGWYRNIKTHMRMAALTVTLGIIHGILALTTLI